MINTLHNTHITNTIHNTIRKIQITNTMNTWYIETNTYFKHEPQNYEPYFFVNPLTLSRLGYHYTNLEWGRGGGGAFKVIHVNNANFLRPTYSFLDFISF